MNLPVKKFVDLISRNLPFLETDTAKEEGVESNPKLGSRFFTLLDFSSSLAVTPLVWVTIASRLAGNIPFLSDSIRNDSSETSDQEASSENFFAQEEAKLNQLESELSVSATESPDKAREQLAVVEALAQKYSEFSQKSADEGAEEHYLQLAIQTYDTLAKVADGSPFEEVKSRRELYTGYRMLSLGDFDGAKAALQKAKDCPEAQEILIKMDRDQNRMRNLGALDVWSSYVEEGQAHDMDEAKGMLGVASGTLQFYVEGDGKTQLDRVAEKWNVDRDLIHEVKARIQADKAEAISEALEQIVEDTEGLRARAQTLLEQGKISSDDGGYILGHLIAYASKAEPDASLTRDLIIDADQIGARESAAQTPYGVYSFLKSTNPGVKEECDKQLAALEQGKNLPDQVWDMIRTTGTDDLAQLAIMHGATKVGSVAKLAALGKLEKLGVTGYKALSIAYGAEVLAEGTTMWVLNTGYEAMGHDTDKVFDLHHLLNTYGANLIMVGGLKATGALSQKYAPKIAEAFKLGTEKELTKGGQMMVVGLNHLTGLGAMVGTGQLNQTLGLSERPKGGFTESFANDVFTYLKYGVAEKGVDHVLGPDFVAAREQRQREIQQKEERLLEAAKRSRKVEAPSHQTEAAPVPFLTLEDARRTLRLFDNPLLAPLWMMLGVDGLGGAGKIAESGKRESIYRQTAAKDIIETRLNDTKVIEGITLGKGDLIRLTPEGHLLSVKLAANRSILGIPCKAGYWINFHTSGKVREAVLSQDVVINDTLCDGNESFTLREDGELESILGKYGMLYRFHGNSTEASSVLSSPEYKKAKSKLVALQMYNLFLISCACDFEEILHFFADQAGRLNPNYFYSVYEYSTTIFLGLIPFLLAPNINFASLYSFTKPSKHLKGRDNITPQGRASSRPLLEFRSGAGEGAKPNSTEESRQNTPPRTRVAALKTSEAGASHLENETAALDELRSEEESEEDNNRPRSAALKATIDEIKPSEDGGKLHAVAAPALFGMDLLTNGHPTITGILLSAFAALASSGAVMGIFDCGKKGKGTPEAPVEKTSLQELNDSLLALQDKDPQDPRIQTQYSIIADLLQSQGDPRGEWIALELQLQDLRIHSTDLKAVAKLEAEAAKIRKQLEQDILVRFDLVADYQFDATRGFSLKLDGRKYKNASSQHLGRFLQSDYASLLTALELESFRPAQEWLLSEPDLSHLTRLRELTIRGSNLNVEGVLAITTSQAFDKLRNLNLEDNVIGDEGARVIAASQTLGKLQKLFLGRNGIGVEGARAIAESQPLGNLQTLDLFRNDLGDGGARVLGASQTLSHLQTLGLGYNGIGTEGARGIAASQILSHLQTLDLGYNRIGEDGTRSIAESQILSNLQKLFLLGNGIGDEGARAIAESQTLSHLQTLNLIGNFIRGEGARAIAVSQTLGNLQTLDLRSNDIGDEGARALASSQTLSHLQTLNLGFNGIGDEEMQAIVKILNEQRIRRRPTPPEKPNPSDEDDGKLHAIAAPALFGIDLLTNGHPTLLGILVTGLAMLGSSASVLGIFSRKTQESGLVARRRAQTPYRINGNGEPLDPAETSRLARKNLKHSNPYTRMGAISILLDIKDYGAIPDLMKCLDDRDPAVAHFAYIALQQLEVIPRQNKKAKKEFEQRVSDYQDAVLYFQGDAVANSVVSLGAAGLVAGIGFLAGEPITVVSAVLVSLWTAITLVRDYGKIRKQNPIPTRSEVEALPAPKARRLRGKSSTPRLRAPKPDIPSKIPADPQIKDKRTKQNSPGLKLDTAAPLDAAPAPSEQEAVPVETGGELEEAEREEQAEHEAELQAKAEQPAANRASPEKPSYPDRGGKLRSIAAPALFGLDLLNNGHPTTLSLAAGALSLLPLFPGVIGGIFGGKEKKSKSSSEVPGATDSNAPFSVYRIDAGKLNRNRDASHPLGNVLSHYASGKPKAIRLSKSQLVDGIQVSAEMPVELHENGRVAAARLAKPLYIAGWKVAQGSDIRRDEAGRLQSVRLTEGFNIGDIAIPNDSVLSFDSEGCIVGIDHPQFDYSSALKKVDSWRYSVKYDARWSYKPWESSTPVEAAFALAKWGDRMPIRDLLAILERSPKSSDRAQAAMYLGKLKAKEAFPALMTIASSPYETTELRSQALRSLEILAEEFAREGEPKYFEQGRLSDPLPRELYFGDMFNRISQAMAVGAFMVGFAVTDTPFYPANAPYLSRLSDAVTNPWVAGMGVVGLMSLFTAWASNRVYRQRGERVKETLIRNYRKSEIREEEFTDTDSASGIRVELDPDKKTEAADAAEAEREGQAEEESGDAETLRTSRRKKKR